MAELKEARVPDIGGHDGVPVIEVLVKVGDSVAKDQGLVTLESDKATMEVPSPFAGIVRELGEGRSPLPPRLNVFSARRGERAAGEQQVDDRADAFAVAA